MKKYPHKHLKLARQHKKKSFKQLKLASQRKKKSFKPKSKFNKAGFRWIEDLHNIHKGKEIWVLGGGWSMDDFPDDFFKDKLAIAHRTASIAFPYCNYAWSGYRNGKITEFLKFQGKSGFRKIILGLSGGARPSALKWLGKNWKDPIYMEKKELIKFKFKLFKDKIGDVAKCIIEGRHCCFLDYETTIHFSIEAAIMLGASKVTLVGCSHKEKEGEVHAKKRGFSHYYPQVVSEDPPLWRRARLGTGLLVQTFEPYDISIRRYFFGKGYESIPTFRDLLNSGKGKIE